MPGDCATVVAHLSVTFSLQQLAVILTKLIHLWDWFYPLTTSHYPLPSPVRLPFIPPVAPSRKPQED
jgi:hypothetical protein